MADSQVNVKSLPALLGFVIAGKLRKQCFSRKRTGILAFWRTPMKVNVSVAEGVDRQNENHYH
jgi:hypothetical protein